MAKDQDAQANDVEKEKDKSKGLNRRSFLLSTSAAAVGAAALSQAKDSPETSGSQAFRSKAGSVIPFSQQELLQEGKKQRTLSGEHLSEIAFPIGGIGAGTVSLGGRGQLRDWEIFNRPGKGKILPFSFVALWARPEGEKAQVKVVEGVLTPPFRGGGGFPRMSAEGLPRFRNARFTGSYPFARIDFEDESVPVQVSLEAFNPLIPLNVDDSSLPVAIFKYQLKSTSKRPVDLALAFSLFNAVGYDGKADYLGELDASAYSGFGKNLNTVRKENVGSVTVNGIDMTSAKYGPDDALGGSMAILTTSPDATATPAWAHGGWWDAFQQWHDEFAANGEFRSGEAKPSDDGQSDYATLAPRLRLQPGESKTVTFILAWYFPVRENYWNQDEPSVKGKKLRNQYGTRFQSAWEVATHTASRLPELEQKTRAFDDAFFSTTLPGYVLEAVSSQSDIIRTTTCLLLEGNQFFGFEGCNDNDGCCPMNCTHVWNYEQALAFLYPELERSMRHTDYTYNMRSDDSMAFRTLLPLGNGQWGFRPCADGQMGCIMKLYREWQISGDDEFLKALWPNAKRSLDFAWVYWDADKDGLFEGEQHNTYDIEFYGPNPMMTTLYHGALRAGELMATAVGDSASADSYREIREKGIENLQQLWNGEFYMQKVPPANSIKTMEKYSKENWHSDAVQNGEIRYQFGDGCLSDQLLGAWMATVLGLDPGWSPEQIRKALQSVYRYNFRNNFYDHPNTQRIYVVNDEKGLLLCSWPKGGRPSLPFPYSDEVWTGIEFQVAAHMIYEGLVEEGLAIVKAITDRYDGRRQNPWNEIECGHHYSRALASWSVLLALSGYRYSGIDKSITFAPVLNAADFRTFFAAGTGWGSYSQRAQPGSLVAHLDLHHGELALQFVNLRNEGGAGMSVTSVVGPHGKVLTGYKLETQGKNLRLDLGTPVTIAAGSSLKVSLSASHKA